MNKKDDEFKQIYKESKDKIYRLCLSFVGNKADADDLFQDIYIKVWYNLKNFRKESNINTWIYRIAMNTALLQLNKKNKSNKRYSTVESEHLKKEVEENETNHYSEEELNELHQAISSLKKVDRIITHLLLEDNSYNEIAEITGLSVSNVGVRINRIKTALAKKMK
ncbi:RNA polymerase sigma factor [Tenacibaculum aiptasiae]|nr:RNA polymerase sigma factor [Tenacibaculum aiptasiae]